MRFFIYDPNSQNNIDPATIAQVDGYCLQYYIENFLLPSGYGGAITDLKQKINLIASYDKKTGISIMWGANCGNAIWNNFPYVEMVTKHHEGSGPPLFNKFPVPFNNDYLNKINSFLQWLSIQLAPVIEKISYIKICGINRTTPELRIPAQDFTSTNDNNAAYTAAAQKWIEAEYSYFGILQALIKLVGYYEASFKNTVLVASLIAGKAGFPCIDINGNVCSPVKRPDINNNIIDYLRAYDNTAIQATALTDIGGAPANFVNSGLPMYYQLDYAVFGKPVTSSQFENAILKGIVNKGEVIEVINNNVKQFPEIIKKYRA